MLGLDNKNFKGITKLSYQAIQDNKVVVTLVKLVKHNLYFQLSPFCFLSVFNGILTKKNLNLTSLNVKNTRALGVLTNLTSCLRIKTF